MLLPMCTILFFVLTSSVISCNTCEELFREQRENERNEESKKHGCRACKPIPYHASNCPEMGYDCGANLPLSSNILIPDACNCAQLRCADTNATLAVGGHLVSKVRCSARAWITPAGQPASSTACARKCGLGVCSDALRSDLAGQVTLGPLEVSPPDEQHPCAWGVCELGAVAKKGSADLSFEGPSYFACSGDGTWKYTGLGAEQLGLRDVACSINDKCPALRQEGCDNNAGCKDAMITSSSISCDAGLRIHFIGRRGSGSENGPWTCKGSDWTLPDGRKIIDALQMNECDVSCRP